MPQVADPTIKSVNLTPSGSSKASSIDVLLAFLLASSIAVLTFVWFCYDYHWPLQDEARHILNSMAACDLLAHCRPWQYHWWCQCSTVDQFYPPFAYFVNGSFLLLFGQSRLVEHLYMAFYAGLMTLSVYAITRLLNGTRRVACIAAICLAIYPDISGLSHTFFLELPEVAMTAFALMVLLWWRSNSTLKIGRTIVSGVALGAACLTKQLVAAYILPVGLYFFIADLISALRNRQGVGSKDNFVRLGHTVALGVTTFLIGLPFLMASYESNRAYTNDNLAAFASKGINVSFLDKLNLLFQPLPNTMSPILLAIFVMSILLLRRKEYKYLLPVIISGIGGVCLSCLWPGMSQDHRYLLPFFIVPAIFSSFFLERLLSSGNRLWQVAAIIAITVASYDYLTYNYSPYPLPLPRLPWQSERSFYTGNPTRYADWGHSFVLETIKKIDGNKLAYLNILPNFGGLHVYAFNLFLKEAGNKSIVPTSSRSYTLVGDDVKFSPKAALGPNWYLWKTGFVGYSLYNKQSERNFERLVNFVRKSGNYKMVAQKELPDGSELMLYRRRF